MSESAALEAAAWQDFVARLGTHLAERWPAMPERLGERYTGFIELAVQQALAQGLKRAPAVARYVNLCFVWGPAFHDKPGGEWAQTLLAGARAGTRPDGLVTHQLVQHSLLELDRTPAAITPAALAAADAALLDSFGSLGRRGAMRVAVPPLPRAACDVEAFELRLLDSPGQAYRLVGGEWQRGPIPPPAPVRVRAGQSMPRLVGVLAVEERDAALHAGLAVPAPGGVSQAVDPDSAVPTSTRLQARLAPAAVCDRDRHPALAFTGPLDRQAWAGHETRAMSWSLSARAAEPPPAGPGSLVAEETSPELYKLELEACGVRDEGEALAPAQLIIGAWPSAQWWIELQRAEPAAQPLLPGSRPWQRAATRCRVERDGQAQDADPLKRQFEQGLDAALAEGLQRLGTAWQAAPELASASLQGRIGLLIGQARATWGWWPSADGLAGAPFMRLLADLALDACPAELELAGELQLGGARARLSVSLAGHAPMQRAPAPGQPLQAQGQSGARAGQPAGGPLQREVASVSLLSLLPRAVARWRYPYAVQLEPLASTGGALLQRIGPAAAAAVAGALPASGLVGEAGLRPCTHGRSGWEWYAQLRLEPLLLPWVCVDPLLGEQRGLAPLLPALTLVDWSMG